MIKVLHTEWSNGWGGQEIRIINEMLAVREKGVEVLLACREDSIIKQKALQNNIKVFTLPFRGNLDLKTLFALKKIIKKEKIDILNTHSGKDTWVGGLAAKIAGIKFVRTRHLANKIKSSKLNFINELADFVITTGENVKNNMIQYNRIKPDKIVSIPTGADHKLFDPLQYNRDECREKLHLKDNEIAIGALGVVRKVKRYNDFIEAAEMLLEKYNNLKFFIAGDGPLFEQYMKYIKEHNLEEKIIMIGHIEDVASYLTALDIFVNSSESEGVSQAIIQALMMEKSVVATDVGSTKDLFYKDNFLLCPAHAPKELSLQIEKYIIDEKATNTLEQKQYIVDNFSKESMAKRVLDVYQKVLS